MTLLPLHAALTPQEFRSLSLADQLEHLLQVDARRKALLLLEADNGAALMAALPVQEVYLLVKTLDPDQAPDLLALASPEQWTGFFDLACWTGDRLQPDAARTWLQQLLQADDVRVVSTLQQMNFELLILLIKKEVRVMAGPESLEEDDSRIEAANRTGGYQLEYRDEESAKLYGALLDRLFSADPDFYRYLLEAVRGETESLVEESVYQQRAARLLDLGFPEPFEAGLVYARLDAETFRHEAHRKLPLGLAEESVAPGFAVTLARADGLLRKILATGVDGATAWELASLVNKVTMADGVDIGEIDQLREVIRKTYGLVNLGLEYLADGDADAAAGLFQEVYAEHLFRLGYSLTQSLQRRAQALADSAIGAYLDPLLRDFIDPLLAPCPRYYRGLEAEGEDASRWFAELEDVRRCEEWLAFLEVQRRLFEEHFDFDLAVPASFDPQGAPLAQAGEVTLSELFLTALANRLLGRSFQPRPLAAADLTALHRQVCQNGQLASRVEKETVAWLDSLEAGGGAFAEYCLSLWQETLCPLAEADLDPRYVAGLMMQSVP